MYSDKEFITCKNCDFKAEYATNLTFKPITGELPYDCVKAWFDDQSKKLDEVKDSITLSDEKVQMRMIDGHKRDKLVECDITADKNALSVIIDGVKTDYPYSDLYGVTVLGKKKINYYLSNGLVLQIKGFDRFNSIKYLDLYELYKKEI